MRGDCSGCYFFEQCARPGVCDDYYDVCGPSEEELDGMIEDGRAAYLEAYTAYLRDASAG